MSLNSKELLISLKNVGFTYNKGLPFEQKALSNINLNIFSSKIISIIGHTGSGKSTLIQLLNSQLIPDEGEIKWYFDDIYDEKGKLNKKKLCSKVGILFQYPEDQVFEETVFDDIAFGPKMLGFDKEKIEELVLNSIRLIGIDESILFKSPFELSGGMLRKVAICGILAIQPKVLVLDEPMAGLDPISCDNFANILLNLKNNQNITIVMVSHNLEYVALLSDEVYCLYEGKIVLSGTPYDVFLKYDELLKYQIGILPIIEMVNYFKEKNIFFDRLPLSIEELIEGLVKLNVK